jgi:hypothetical protein
MDDVEEFVLYIRTAAPIYVRSHGATQLIQPNRTYSSILESCFF